MNAVTWLSQQVVRLDKSRSKAKAKPATQGVPSVTMAELEPGAMKIAINRPSNMPTPSEPVSFNSVITVSGADHNHALRSTHGHSKQERSLSERLSASLRRAPEHMSPRALRRILESLQGILDHRISEVEGGRRAMAFAQDYIPASMAAKRDVWLLMSELFAPDTNKIKSARQAYEVAVGTADEGTAEIRLNRAMSSPRRRLLQRFGAYSQGMRFLIDMRADLLPNLKTDSRLLALESELESLFTTWFDVGFLELQRISWDSPASLIEKLILYEAVHDIKSWADVKNRLDVDRRCYGFFHPRMPNEPLIFVEVALLEDMAGAIAPLLDETEKASDSSKATTAIFYSISNTQQGLRGLSFGDSLIKRVVETLKDEFPKLKQFATLSPMPGFRSWLQKQAPDVAKALADQAIDLAHDKSPDRKLLMHWASRYLTQTTDENQPLDAVARFHLSNGARIERLNWAGDLSSKGLRQSFGLMVNYLYDLKKLDKHRAMLAKGKIAVGKSVEACL